MKITGTIENIIFRNDLNGYTVLQVRDCKTVFTLIGNITSLNVGETIDAETEIVNNETYGKQYKIKDYSIIMPDEDLDAIEKFIASLKVRGVGEQSAKRIVDEFCDDTIDTIINYPEKLYSIKGMTETKINNLRDKIITRKSEIDIVIALTKYNLGPMTIRNIIDEYGEDTLKVIEENPYQMALTVDGVGFVICDSIAKINGYDVDSEKRVAAAILYVLENEYMQGNVYIYKEYLITKTIELLAIDNNYDLSGILDNLEIELKIVQEKFMDKDLVFLKYAYNTEKKLTDILFDRADDITIITGGPGTGKTYNIKKYLNEAEDKGLIVELCAPTGRAAKRITEVTGHEAKTIHRLLECVGAGDGRKTYFQRNLENPLSLDLLIVDEMSMVDEFLMLKLIQAVPNGAKIVLVGDVDQLPSVGAGQVLKDMIDSNKFSVTRLTKIHRQVEGSNIVINAHLVNEGKTVDFSKDCEDLKFIHKSGEEKIKEAITKLAKDIIPNHFKIENDQIQIICQSKIGNCGVESLNNVLQAAINPKDALKDEIVIGERVIRLGDKVMQTVNNYDIPYDVIDKRGLMIDRGTGVFNGDIGFVKEIDNYSRNIVVKYDDKDAFYGPKDIKDLTLAYAITVHKSQGSEYEVVIMPMINAPLRLKNRKILYTAMTRAKKCLLFVGIESYFHEMAKNVNEVERNSALCSKLYE